MLVIREDRHEPSIELLTVVTKSPVQSHGQVGFLFAKERSSMLPV
jgi:hypothetical protein